MTATSSPFTRTWNPYTHPAAPLHWRKPQTVRVVPDLFELLTPDEEIDRIFAVMALCPKSTFYVATERPGRMREYLRDSETWRRVAFAAREKWLLSNSRQGFEGDWDNPDEWTAWPLPNVVLATIVRTQEDADTRIPELLECPAAYRAVFLEPRERLIIEYYLPRKLETCQDCGADDGERDHYGRHAYCGGEFDPQGSTEGIDWLHIAGGREPLDLAWVRSLIAQADAAGVPVWVERLGSKAFCEVITEWETHDDPDGGDVHPIASENRLLPLRSRNGSDPEEWPADLVRRERLEVH